VGDAALVDLVAIFQPHRKQAEFIGSMARNRLFLGGRGTGKSWALGLDVLVSALLNPGKPGLFLGRTEGELKQNLLPYFEQHCDTLHRAIGVQMIRRHRPGDQMVELVNGSSFIYKGFENIAKIRMHSACWVAMDEVEHSRVAHEEILRAVKPTIRVAGPRQGLAVASSPNGLVGFTKQFYDHQLRQTPGWYTVRCPSYANPHLSQEDLDDWRASMSADAWRQEVEAIALRAKELVYHQFRPSKHVRPVDVQGLVAAGAHLVLGIDWGLNHAAAVAILVDRSGVWHVFDELTAEPLSRGHWQEQLDKWIGNFRKVPYLIAVDRAVPHETQSLRNKYGPQRTIIAQCDSKKEQEVMGGVAQVQALLDPAAETTPRMVFSDRLNRLDDRATATIIPALEGYRFARALDGSLTDRPLKDDKYDHIADALRMAVVTSLRHRELHGGRLPVRDRPDGVHDGASNPHRAHF
jgi:hypothetical protein